MEKRGAEPDSEGLERERGGGKRKGGGGGGCRSLADVIVMSVILPADRWNNGSVVWTPKSGIPVPACPRGELRVCFEMYFFPWRWGGGVNVGKG